MGHFERGGNKGGFRGGDRGGKPNFQKKSWGNDRGDAPMHKATCSDCGRGRARFLFVQQVKSLFSVEIVLLENEKVVTDLPDQTLVIVDRNEILMTSRIIHLHQELSLLQRRQMTR